MPDAAFDYNPPTTPTGFLHTSSMRLILHAGTHKTGTTTVQHVLQRNRDWLRERGCVYARFRDCAHGHNRFAHRLATSAEAELPAMRDELMANAEPGRTLVLSAEEFSVRILWPEHWRRFDEPAYRDLRRAYVERLRQLVSGFDAVTVFLCLRRQDEYAESLYVTNFHTGRFPWSFEEFRTRCAPIFDYRAREEDLRAAFPDLRLAGFDALRQNLVPAFFEWTGIPLPPGAGGHEKKTPNALLTRWLHASVQPTATVEQQRLRGRFCATREAARLLPPNAGRLSLWQSADERNAFLARCANPPDVVFPPVARSDEARAVLDDGLSRALDAAFENWRQRAGRAQSSAGAARDVPGRR